MNQIPKIEETYNTREVEEKKYPSHKELDMEKYYRIVKSGNFDNMFNYGFDVGKAFHQQELQKAREEALEREKQLKQVHMMELDAISCMSLEQYVAWRDYRKQRPHHSELDQDTELLNSVKEDWDKQAKNAMNGLDQDVSK